LSLVLIALLGFPFGRNSMAQSATSGSTGASAGLLIKQPLVDGITGRLLQPHLTRVQPPEGDMHLLLWQANPHLADGTLVPTKWAAGSKTGFFPSAPLEKKQLGFEDRDGSSTAQWDQDTIGVYLNSRDLPGETHKQKMMVTPQYRFPKGQEPQPFVRTGGALHASLDLQVPTAVDEHTRGSDTYVSVIFLFKDTQGTLISYGVVLFHNGVPHLRVSSNFDTDTGSFIISSPLGEDEQFVTKAQGSYSRMGHPWRGWQHYEFSIDEKDFANATRFLSDKYSGAVHSAAPKDYFLAAVHLNAELHFQTAPSELGWSMRNFEVSMR
jgi:hypothetical protein